MHGNREIVCNYNTFYYSIDTSYVYVNKGKNVHNAFVIYYNFTLVLHSARP